MTINDVFPLFGKEVLKNEHERFLEKFGMLTNIGFEIEDISKLAFRVFNLA